MDIQIKSWKELTRDELYTLLRLRVEVFVVEQNCPYQECDDVDQRAFHLLGMEDDTIVATARIIPASEDEVKLGRIVVGKAYRGREYGVEIVKACISYAEQQMQVNSISMSAQTYLIQFYQNLGFTIEGGEYLEDDIPHIKMIRNSV